MLLVNCILAGLSTVVLAGVVAIGVFILGLSLSHPSGTESEAIGFDPVSTARDPYVLFVAMGAFALGFYLEYRRAT